MLPIITPVFGPEEEQAAAEALRSGWVTQGPRVAAFEQALAQVVGSPHAVAVTSATTGLHLALHAAGIGPGDEVIVPSLSFIATTNAVWMVGATPVFADVGAELPVVTPQSIAEVVTPKTRAVIAVHQLGIPFDRRAMGATCAQRSLLLIEDAACAIGTLHHGRPIAQDAVLSVFSFHPRKVLTMGEGGAVATHRQDLAERMKRLRHHGMSISDLQRHGTSAPREQYLEPAFNYRMTDIQGAIGLVQLTRLDAILQRRRALAQVYDALLAPHPHIVPLRPMAHDAWNVQTYCVRVPALRRDEALRELNGQGIGAKRGIMAAHEEAAWAHLPHRPLPNTEAWSAQSLALPLFHAMTPDQQQQVVEALVAALR
jgi:dTDP-4-amino-4,6-dideoxygalactose transaminase